MMAVSICSRILQMAARFSAQCHLPSCPLPAAASEFRARSVPAICSSPSSAGALMNEEMSRPNIDLFQATVQLPKERERAINIEVLECICVKHWPQCRLDLSPKCFVPTA
jgi:hypothetical protein